MMLQEINSPTAFGVYLSVHPFCGCFLGNPQELHHGLSFFSGLPKWLQCSVWFPLTQKMPIWVTLGPRFEEEALGFGLFCLGRVQEP